MKKQIYTTAIAFFILKASLAFATSPTSIKGTIVSGEELLPFVAITIEGTTIGSTSNTDGYFTLNNIPEGNIVLKIQSVGYLPLSIPLSINEGETKELKIELEEDILGIEEVVITGDRNARNRKDASVIVNTLSPKLFNIANTVTLSEGLNFSPGIRMENNCQNCGFNQVRMNGMEGPYSQILINGRAIFSGLAGVYGLELIPANMMERIEVVRGGGSALYGSNAIAGTINIILKDPINDVFEFAYNSEITGLGSEFNNDPAFGNSINANVSMITDDNNSGMALYGFYRNRAPFDANGDSFSELTQLNNTTFGSRVFHRFGARSKLTGDFFNIKESRRGGDKFAYPLHEAGIAEAVTHNILTGALTYEQYLRSTDLLSIYISGQGVERDSYYGAEQSLKDYGTSIGNTYVIGTQYNADFLKSSLTIGTEGRFESLIDQKLGYSDFENAIIVGDSITYIPHTSNTTVANQTSNTLGIFAQYEYRFKKLNVSIGGRFDNYTISDIANTSEDKKGSVFSPRLTLKYNVADALQIRTSYSKGYRAPQIFDEDLHILTSGSRKVLHENDPNLTQETSHSFMASFDFNHEINDRFFEILMEAFYTQLNNAFVNEVGLPNELGEVTSLRKNANGGAFVTGINTEFNYIPNRKLSLKSGFTIQKSQYENAQDFGEKKFFKTPNNYGFATIDWKPLLKLGVSSTANYTGSMLVPYYGINTSIPDEGELVKSDSFFDWSMKIRYNIELKGITFQVFGGMKNILNSYQNDFDFGINRDPSYIYGPGLPRTVYMGVKLGSFIK